MDRPSLTETFETLLRQIEAETLILETEGRRLEAENQRLQAEIRVLDANRAARSLLNEVLGFTAKDGHESQGFQNANYNTSMETMETWVTNNIEDFKQNFGLHDGITEPFKQDLLALLEKNSQEGVDGMKEYDWRGIINGFRVHLLEGWGLVAAEGEENGRSKFAISKL